LAKSRTWRVRGLVALVAGGCAGEKPANSPRASLLAPADAPPAHLSPAVWRYHPQEEGALAARFELPGGQVLFAGERGERWLVDAKHKRASAAARLAPEDLIAILRPRENSWLFVGASGTGYEADQPLGAFLRSSAPLDPLAHVSAAGSTILGVRRDGHLVRSADAGASWQAVGPAEQRFVDVELLEDGRGLALGVPEQLWDTRDQGATWKRIDAAPFGAILLERDRGAGIVARGAYRVLALAKDGALVPLSGDVAPPRHALGIEPPRGPNAGALAEGRAIILGKRYLELVAEEKQQSSWTLLEGPLDGALVARAFPAARGCRVVRLGGFDRFVYFACARSSAAASTQTVAFQRSEDRGKTWKLEPYSPRAKLSDLAFVVGADGGLVVTGTCATHAAGSGCSAQGVHFRRKANPAPRDDASDARAPKPSLPVTELELAPSATPALTGVAAALAASTDGRTLYAVGRRSKSGAFAVFVSHDAGRSFTARDIEQLAPDVAEEEELEDRFSYRPTSASLSVQSVTSAEDGALAIVFRRYGTSLLVVTDDEGRVIGLSKAPAESAFVGAAGARALAFSPGSRDVWESLDAGAAWEPIGRLPVSLCPSDSACEVPIRCHPGGCVIGDELSRVGWRGQSDENRGVLSPPEAVAPGLFDRKLRTPLSCTLHEGRWQAISGIGVAPDAEKAGIGKAEWFMTTLDPARATAVLHQALGGPHARVESTLLLPPAARPETLAVRYLRQSEGGALIRYTIPEATPGETRLLNLEVGWANLFEGRIGHARLANAGAYAPGDYARVAGQRAQEARPDLVSVAEGGVFVRIHHAARSNQPTYFFDGRGSTSIPAVDWPPTGSLPVRHEMMRSGDVSQPLMLIGDGTAVVRGRNEGGRWSFDAFATGLYEPSSFELTQLGGFAYIGARPGWHVFSYDPAGSERKGWFFPFRAKGAVFEPPTAVPSQLDLSDRPARCSAAQRSTTPRVVVPFQAGSRHPIVVTDSVEPVRVLLTSGAVLHGTPEAPCAVAWDAEAVNIDNGPGAAGAPLPNSAAETVRAILPYDDLEHAWLFRSPRKTNNEAALLEWRTMSCRLDPTQEVPPEVFQVEGTMVRRAR
jgi:hypothetical protein